ncbi:MAG: DUF3592 domain-containing protein [Phycicoccus sp.]
MHDSDRVKDSYVVIRFTGTDGQVVTADVGNYRWVPEPQVGDRPEIVYDPADPSGNVADARISPDFSAVWFLAIGAFLAAALAWPTWTGAVDWNRFGR